MTGATRPPVLVVGAGGLLGRGVTTRLDRSRAVVHRAVVPWHDADGAVRALVGHARELLDAADGGPWDLVWAAGAGVTATSAATLDAEVGVVRRFVDGLLAEVAPGVLASGTLFVASSAGGVYAGGAQPPFTEEHEPAPLAPYGHAKLAIEAEIGRLATAGGARVVVGRISNLYGPGQDLTKPQGLVSQMCRAQALVEPIGVYVSMDTLRDYLFVDDAAALVEACLDVARDRVPAGGVVVKILASQRSASIAALVGEMRRIFKRRPLVRLAASPQARQQARDLRFRSIVWPDLDRRAQVPLPAGILATATDITAQVSRGVAAGAGSRPSTR